MKTSAPFTYSVTERSITPPLLAAFGGPILVALVAASIYFCYLKYVLYQKRRQRAGTRTRSVRFTAGTAGDVREVYLHGF